MIIGDFTDRRKDCFYIKRSIEKSRHILLRFLIHGIDFPFGERLDNL